MMLELGRPTRSLRLKAVVARMGHRLRNNASRYNMRAAHGTRWLSVGADGGAAFETRLGRSPLVLRHPLNPEGVCLR
jgi:hypothetical protein